MSSLGRTHEPLATAKLQLAGASVRVAIHGTEDGTEEVVLLEAGARSDAVVPLVRIHSACFTGDVLGSLGCDCGPQLHLALERIRAAEHGMLVYLLRHEGRGIGLANKVRAYNLQERGLDTVAANVALGFPPDARDYGAAVHALQTLDVTCVRLMTNNPAKVAALEMSGIAVIERVPMPLLVNEYNRKYLRSKRDTMGHLIQDI